MMASLTVQEAAADEPPLGNAGSAAPSPRVEELLLQVDVNDQGLDETVLALRTADGKVAVQGESLDRWRLLRPNVAPRVVNGASYYPLDAIPGLTYAFDFAKQRLAILAPAAAFRDSRFVNQETPYPRPIPSAPGGFFNYDLFASRSAGVSQYSGQFEAGFFNPYGVLIGNFLEQDISGTRSTIRLDTTWTSDFPEKLTTLRIGDANSVPGAWGRSVHFGGVQYGTNFATQPGFISFPSIAANGQAALPSTVDVFVNNALVAQRPVPPGPFSITNIPTVDGSGNVQLVVHDMFGRERVITQPFYASVNLLKAGLDSFSVEAGAERNNFGIESSDYSSGFASGTYRRGLTDFFTGEVRGEVARDFGVVGVGADYLVDEIGVVSATLAASSGSGANGGLAGAGFQRQTSRLNVFAQGLWSSAKFRQIGATSEAPVPLRQWSASVSYQFDAFGSAGVTYVAQDFRTKANLHVLSANYSLAIGSWGFFSFSAVKSYGAAGNVSYNATLTIPFGERSIVSLAYNALRDPNQGNTSNASLTLQRSLPLGEGYGYRVVANSTHNDFQASGTWQNNIGSYTAEYGHFQSESATRFNVTGGIGLVGGHPFLSRQLTDSFAVVRVADYAGVGVLQDNQPAGRTGADGYAVLPELRAFDINPVSIDQQDLPLDATLGSLKMVVVPYYRSGLLLDFPVQRSHGATLHIMLDDGAPMPSGAIVQIVGRDDQFPVALGGEAYLTGLEEHNRLRATWKGKGCEFDAEFPPSADPLPNLGTFVCHGVMR